MRLEWITTTWLRFCLPTSTTDDVLDELRAADVLEPYGKTHLVHFEPGEVVLTDDRWREWRPMREERGLRECAEDAIKRAKRARQPEPAIVRMRILPTRPDETGNRMVRFLDPDALVIRTQQQTATGAA